MYSSYIERSNCIDGNYMAIGPINLDAATYHLREHNLSDGKQKLKE